MKNEALLVQFPETETAEHVTRAKFDQMCREFNLPEERVVHLALSQLYRTHVFPAHLFD